MISSTSRMAFSGIRPQAPKFGALAYTAQDAQQLQKDVRDGRVLFWDVDTQIGFMDPIKKINTQQGVRRVGLFVPNATEIKPNLKTLTDLHYDAKIPRVATMDSHDANDPEFANFKTLPDGSPLSDEHCVKRNPLDWAKIAETQTPTAPRYISVSQGRKDVPTVASLQDLFQSGRSVVLEKNTLSAFEHRVGETPETATLNTNWKAEVLVDRLKQLGIRTAIVYGVATDFCVQVAVKGLKQLGIRPIVVKDAVKGINEAQNPLNDPNDAVFGDVTETTTQDVVKAVRG